MKNLFMVLFLFTVIGHSQNRLKVLNDSAMAIYKENPQKAIQLLEDALDISLKEKNKFESALSKNNLGIVYRDLGELEKAKQFSEESLEFGVLDEYIMASAYNNIGACNRKLGLYEEAIDSYLKALAIYESKGDLDKQATVNNNIGMVYSYLNLNDKAIEYHLKAKNVFEQQDNKKGISEVYNNIAIIYANDGNLENALDYFKYSLDIEKELKDQKGIAESFNNVGAVYYYMQEIDSALVYFKGSADTERAIGNLAGVGTSYNNIAQVLMENDRLQEAKIYIDSAYYFATQSKTSEDIELALLNYSQFYEAKNNLKLAYQYYKDYSAYKDSISEQSNIKSLQELEVKYQTERKEKEILSQRADIAEKELSLSKKNIQLFGLGVFAIVLALLGYLFYNQQKLKNRQLKKENELQDALLKIETQTRLQEQRLRISRDLHDNIGAQLTFIISSLDNLKYGFKLPENVSSKIQSIATFTSSTITDLRDTIWAMNKSEISFEDLQSRISNFIDKANLAATHISFVFNLENALKDQTFTSVVGMNIYRIIQEAVNNAIKYAHAKTIEVRISEEENGMKISILDDGDGFDLDAVEFGNGLNNLKKRAHDIQASLKIDSKLGSGTHIELTMFNA